VTDQLTWAQRARNWSLRCSTTLPGCPWSIRLLERKSDDDIHRDVQLVQSGLMGAIAEHRIYGRGDDSRVGELLVLTREAELLLFQFEHRNLPTFVGVDRPPERRGPREARGGKPH